MGMRRINARNYAVYLQRRAEDFGDPERPIPKWTDLDHEAVRELVREFWFLDRWQEDLLATLHEHGLPPPPPPDGFDALDPALLLEPQPPTTIRPWWRIWGS